MAIIAIIAVIAIIARTARIAILVIVSIRAIIEVPARARLARQGYVQARPPRVEKLELRGMSIS